MVVVATAIVITVVVEGARIEVVAVVDADVISELELA